MKPACTAYTVAEGTNRDTGADGRGMATRGGAEALGILTRGGTVEVGKRADLVLLGADPLADM